MMDGNGGIRISEHFRRRWVERVGGDCPSSKELENWLQESKCLQPGQDILTWSGRIHRILGLYYQPNRDVFLFVDEKKGVAVTVLPSPRNGHGYFYDHQPYTRHRYGSAK